MLRYVEGTARHALEKLLGVEPQLWRSPCDCDCWVLYAAGICEGRGPMLWAMTCFVDEEQSPHLADGARVKLFGLENDADILEFIGVADEIGILVTPTLNEALHAALVPLPEAT